MPPEPRVIVIGFDGMDPGIAEVMLDSGELPHLASIRSAGGFARLQTTTPAQTPAAWSTFATGVNPGGHGIFDFLHRDPRTYLPNLALSRYEQRSALLPPRAVNLRSGTPVWERLARAGVPATILRCPCTFPPDAFKGRLLAGMGVPDIRGGLGTATFFSTAEETPGEGEQVARLSLNGSAYRASLPGPRVPGREDLAAELHLEVDADAPGAVLTLGRGGDAIPLRPGAWTPWVQVKFRAGLLHGISGLVRFVLLRVSPHVELYASPVNFDPKAPLFPISHPWEYAWELERAVGAYGTLGMPEDHTGLTNGRLSEDDFLGQCDAVMNEREAMLRHELDRHREGLLYCLFDTPDRIQHMFWRFREADHPANAVHGLQQRYTRVIEEHYARCDRIVGEVLRSADDRTLVMVLSDHGFNGFRRGIHLNSWLHANGWLALQSGVAPGEAAGQFLRHVDWGRTRAYALGFGSVYLNVAGREAQGIVAHGERAAAAGALARQLAGFVDTERGTVAIRQAWTREQLFAGPRVDEAPDVVVGCAAGYRVSWATPLGGIPGGLFEDNTRKWAGDHIVDPALVPGVLFMNRSFRDAAPRLVDCTPTILAALGVAPEAGLEGESLLR
jgi:predicted AlkP superfamily phosphohydrolase/phosphomutase